MAPPIQFTKQNILDAAFRLTRKKGIQAVTARAIAKELGSSVKPIFRYFQNMAEVEAAVLEAANTLYQSRITAAMQAGKYPPYKASGIAYIRFAQEEPELFKLLFMRDRSQEAIAEDRESIRDLLKIIQENLGISEDEAYQYHLEMWLYVHGIATMMATAYLEWDDEFIDRAFSDMYFGLNARYKEKYQKQ